MTVFVEELRGTNTQGKTLEEARENLREAVELVLKANRELAEKSLVGRSIVREPFELSGLGGIKLLPAVLDGCRARHRKLW